MNHCPSFRGSDTQRGSDKIIQHFIKEQNRIINQINDTSILGSFKNISLIGTKYGYKDFLSGALNGNFSIVVRDGRYRVIVYDITEFSNLSNKYLTMEWYALDRQCRFKSGYGFTQYIGKMLELMFTDWFAMKEENFEQW